MTNGSHGNTNHDSQGHPATGSAPAVHAEQLASEAGQERHSERVEFLGVMATGIAHEFNNLLTIVLGNVEQLRRQPLNQRGHEQLARVEWGARQAERLVRQMLNLAGRRASDPQVVDLNAIIAEFDKIIGHAVKDEVHLVLELGEGSLPVHLDPAQLELALLNLVRNASDAMGGAGSITIRTAGHRVDGLGGKPTVEVSVSDTGSGMPPDIVRQATTSFFTTKPPGQGSGLGLWMVQSFVTDWQGKLDIETAVGRGTTVRLVFPRAE